MELIAVAVVVVIALLRIAVASLDFKRGPPHLHKTRTNCLVLLIHPTIHSLSLLLTLSVSLACEERERERCCHGRSLST